VREPEIAKGLVLLAGKRRGEEEGRETGSSTPPGAKVATGTTTLLGMGGREKKKKGNFSLRGKRERQQYKKGNCIS